MLLKMLGRRHHLVAVTERGVRVVGLVPDLVGTLENATGDLMGPSEVLGGLGVKSALLKCWGD